MSKRKHHSSYGGESGSSVCCGCCYCSKTTKAVCCTAIWLPVLVLAGLVLAVLINTALISDPYERMQLASNASMMDVETGREDRIERFMGAIAIETISYSPSNLSLTETAELIDYIEAKFPLVHGTPDVVTRTVVNGHSLLYKVVGEEEGTLNPYLLTAHLDVVPPGDYSAWTRDPWGERADHEGEDTIYGRGTIDDKHSVFGILEALEYRLANGERPARSFYIAFGHDEEVSGHEGAAHIAEELKTVLKPGEKIDFLLDEGMFVMKDIFPGVTDPLIYIGVAEKGWATVELEVEGVQGHSSTPPRESAIGILSNAIAKLEAHRQPSRFGTGPEVETVKYAAPHASFILKMALSNLWLFSNIVASVFGAAPDTDAVQRTTTAVTIVRGGVKENIVPYEASAIVNHRIHTADSASKVLERDRKTVNDDRVSVNLKDYFEPTVVSPHSNDAVPFQAIVNSALDVFPNGHAVPGLMVANTDTIHYTNLTDKIYRFTPVYMLSEDTTLFHGIDERISVKNYDQVVQFYYRLMAHADSDIVVDKLAVMEKAEEAKEEEAEEEEILEKVASIEAVDIDDIEKVRSPAEEAHTETVKAEISKVE